METDQAAHVPVSMALMKLHFTYYYESLSKVTPCSMCACVCVCVCSDHIYFGFVCLATEGLSVVISDLVPSSVAGP